MSTPEQPAEIQPMLEWTKRLMILGVLTAWIVGLFAIAFSGQPLLFVCFLVASALVGYQGYRAYKRQNAEAALAAAESAPAAPSPSVSAAAAASPVIDERFQNLLTLAKMLQSRDPEKGLQRAEAALIELLAKNP